MNYEDYENDIKLVKKQIKNKKKGVIIVVSLLVILCGIITFFVLSHYYKKTTSISFENYEVYQYFSGKKYNFTGKVTYENGIVSNISDNGEKIEVGDNPIYYQSIDNECIIPITMGLFFLKNKGDNYRINYFSKLKFEISDGNEMALVSYNDNTKYIDDAFLYDGRNTYVFPYSVSLEVEGKTYDLSPLSYVFVNYKDCVEIYNKAIDEYVFIDDIKKDVIATFGDYKINLSTDMIMYPEDERLLIKNVGKLNVYE